MDVALQRISAAPLHLSNALLLSDLREMEFGQCRSACGHNDWRASAARKLINASSITALFVVEDGRRFGIIHIHDLLRAGVA